MKFNFFANVEISVRLDRMKSRRKLVLYCSSKACQFDNNLYSFCAGYNKILHTNRSQRALWISLSFWPLAWNKVHSDCHLSAGEPPLIRIDGDLKKLEHPA